MAYIPRYRNVPIRNPNTVITKTGDDVWQEIFVTIANYHQPQKHWRYLGYYLLGCEVDALDPYLPVKDKLLTILNLWRQRKSRMATFKSLVRRLETMKFYTCAGIVPYILIIYMYKDIFFNDVSMKLLY